MLRSQVVDSIRGYHELGFALTGHEHWRGFKPERREAAADSLTRVIERMPPNVQASLLIALAWGSVGLVSFEVLVAPAVASVKISRAEKKKAADAAKKGKEGEPESGTGK